MYLYILHIHIFNYIHIKYMYKLPEDCFNNMKLSVAVMLI